MIGADAMGTAAAASLPPDELEFGLCYHLCLGFFVPGKLWFLEHSFPRHMAHVGFHGRHGLACATTPKNTILVMRGRRDCGLVPLRSRRSCRLVPISAPGLVVRNTGLQTGLQRRRATGVQSRRQVAAHIGSIQLAARVCAGMCGQVLGIGQQLVDLTISIHPTGSHRSPTSRCALERALMQRTDGLHGIALAGGAQMIFARQILRLWQAGAGP